MTNPALHFTSVHYPQVNSLVQWMNCTMQMTILKWNDAQKIELNVWIQFLFHFAI